MSLLCAEQTKNLTQALMQAAQPSQKDSSICDSFPQNSVCVPDEDVIVLRRLCFCVEICFQAFGRRHLFHPKTVSINPETSDMLGWFVSNLAHPKDSVIVPVDVCYTGVPNPPPAPRKILQCFEPSNCSRRIPPKPYHDSSFDDSLFYGPPHESVWSCLQNLGLNETGAGGSRFVRIWTIWNRSLQNHILISHVLICPLDPNVGQSERK